MHYVAGSRVLSQLGVAYDRNHQLAVKLSVTPPELLDRFDDMQRKSKETDRALKALSAEVVALTVDTMRSRLGEGEKVLHVNRPTADPDFIKSLATALDEALAEHMAVLLVTVGEGHGEGTFTLAGPAALVDSASSGVAKALEGRGGGKGGRFQGKCARLGGVTEAIAAAKAVLEQPAAGVATDVN